MPSYKHLRSGVMVAMCNYWLKKKAIFEQYLLTAALVSVIMETKEGLVYSVTEREKTSERHQESKAQLVVLDDEFDECARTINCILKALIQAYWEDPAIYEKSHKIIFPRGMRIINTSYDNEYGECERIVGRVEQNPDVLEVLQTSKLNDKPLIHWYDRMINAGLAMGPWLADLNVKEKNVELLKKESVARNEWFALLSTIKKLAKFAKWSEEDYEMIIGPVDEKAKKASLNIPAKKEEPPTTPEDIEE